MNLKQYNLWLEFFAILSLIINAFIGGLGIGDLIHTNKISWDLFAVGCLFFIMEIAFLSFIEEKHK